MTNIGIIDLGSNSARIGIYNTEAKQAVYTGKYPCQLSRGMNADMLLKEDAMNRTATALMGFQEIMKKFQVSEVYAFATAAVRKAENKQEFIDKIARETGINIRVLSGEEEAEFDFLGVIGKTKMADAVILDTGGGSIEIIGAKDGKMTNAVSIPIGSRSIKELFFENGETPVAREMAKARVEEIIDDLTWLADFKGVPVIGIGGCNRTVARICLSNGEKDKMIDCYNINRDNVFQIFDKIGKTAPWDRENIKGITPDRTDIIYGGLLPLIVLMEKLESKRLAVTDAGLKEGIFQKIMENPATF